MKDESHLYIKDSQDKVANTMGTQEGIIRTAQRTSASAGLTAGVIGGVVIIGLVATAAPSGGLSLVFLLPLIKGVVLAIGASSFLAGVGGALYAVTAKTIGSIHGYFVVKTRNIFDINQIIAIKANVDIFQEMPAEKQIWIILNALNQYQIRKRNASKNSHAIISYLQDLNLLGTKIEAIRQYITKSVVDIDSNEEYVVNNGRLFFTILVTLIEDIINNAEVCTTHHLASSGIGEEQLKIYYVGFPLHNAEFEVHITDATTTVYHPFRAIYNDYGLIQINQDLRHFERLNAHSQACVIGHIIAFYTAQEVERSSHGKELLAHIQALNLLASKVQTIKHYMTDRGSGKPSKYFLTNNGKTLFWTIAKSIQTLLLLPIEMENARKVLNGSNFSEEDLKVRPCQFVYVDKQLHLCGHAIEHKVIENSLGVPTVANTKGKRQPSTYTLVLSSLGDTTCLDNNQMIPIIEFDFPSVELSDDDDLGLPSAELSDDDDLGLPSAELSDDDDLGLPSAEPDDDDDLGLPSAEPDDDEDLGFPSAEPYDDEDLGFPSAEPYDDEDIRVPSVNGVVPTFWSLPPSPSGCASSDRNIRAARNPRNQVLQ